MNEADIQAALDADLRIRDCAREVARDPGKRAALLPEVEQLRQSLATYTPDVIAEAGVDLGQTDLDVGYVRGGARAASLRLGRYLRTLGALQSG